MTPHAHAVPPGPVHREPGQCWWTWHFSGVDLACTEAAIPGGRLCPEHLIQLVHERRTRHGNTR